MKSKILTAIAATIIMSNVHATVTASAKAVGRTVPVNSPAMVAGDYQFYIYNNSSIAQTYKVDESVCIQNQNCLHSIVDYNLKPFASINIHNNLEMTQLMTERGNFEVEAILKVSVRENYTVKGLDKLIVY